MNRFYPLLILVLVFITSCKQKKNIDYAIISGKISNAEGELNLLSPINKSFSKSIKLSADGRFIDTLRVGEGFYLLDYGGNVNRLYIENGMELEITIDKDDSINNVSISGNGSEVSKYFFEKTMITNEMVTNDPNLYKIEEEPYKARINEWKIETEKILDRFNGISENFKRKEKRNLHYTYLKYISEYQFLHSRYSEKPGFEVSEGYLDEFDDVDYENIEDYDFSSSYKQIVEEHFMKMAIQLAVSKSIPREVAYIEVLMGIKEDRIKNDLLYNYSVNNITYSKELEDFYSAFMLTSTDDEHKALITKSYDELKKVLRGSPSPKFKNYENYNGGTTSLDDFKGKYMYIGVWATWSDACIAEIPYLKKIEKKYHWKNIEIISISVDDENDYEKWRKMIVEKEFSGTQLLADNAFKSDFIQEYLIRGIPRFILIDPNGNIVESNAPLPSNPKLIELFSELDI